MIKKYFMFTEALKRKKKKIRFITEKSDSASLWQYLGLSVQALISGIFITLSLGPSKSRIRNLQSIGRGFKIKR